MNSYSEPTPEQEIVGGGEESVSEPVDPKTESPEEVVPDDDDIASGRITDGGAL